MCSSHRPTAGADSEVERPYRVLIEEWNDGRAWIAVSAIGPRGAEVTARQVAIDKGYDLAAVLRVEEAA